MKNKAKTDNQVSNKFSTPQKTGILQDPQENFFMHVYNFLNFFSLL